MNLKKNLKELYKIKKVNNIFKVLVIFLIPIIFIAGFFILDASNIEEPELCEVSENTNLKKIPLKVISENNEVTLIVEVAETNEERGIGLMCRKELSSNSGMLFIFPYSGMHSFWMKNTLISLDIIFLDNSKKIINIHSNTIPNREDIFYTSTEKSKYVLEVNNGFALKYNLKKGDSIDF